MLVFSDVHASTVGPVREGFELKKKNKNKTKLRVLWIRKKRAPNTKMGSQMNGGWELIHSFLHSLLH